MRYSAKRMRRCQRNDGERDISDDALCVVFGMSFTLFLLPVPIIEIPLGISRQIRMNNEASFSEAHSSPETVHRIHTVGSCECRGKVPRQSGIVLRLPLIVPAEVGSQDALRILGPECSFFFIVLPPVNFNGFITLSNFRGNSCNVERRCCRVCRKMQKIVELQEKTGSAEANPVSLYCLQYTYPVHFPA